jgi:hypothetical protein
MAIGKAPTTRKQSAAAVVPLRCGLKDMVTGGALPQGYYEFANVRTGIAKYKTGQKAPALMVDLYPVNEGNERVGEVHQQFWSAGNIDRIVPVKDGEVADEGSGFGAINGASGISDNSNYAIFLSKLVEAGMPEDFVEDDVTVLEGLIGLIVQTAAPERAGMPRNQGATQKESEDTRPSTIYVVGEIRKGPWEEEDKPKAAPAPAKGKPAASKKAAKFDAIDVLGEALGEVLEGSTEAKQKNVRLKLFSALKKKGLEQEQVDEVLEQFADADTLSAVLEGIGWEMDKAGNLTPAE